MACCIIYLFSSCSLQPYHPQPRAASLRTVDVKPPENSVNNLCYLFRRYPHWAVAAERSAQKWGTPLTIMMAIMHQESKFDGEARPPNRNPFSTKKYASSAYGYAQALDASWEDYQKANHASHAKRNIFMDAIDFIGWYTKRTHQVTGISQYAAYDLYLAYHEGWNGYLNKTYRFKPWLMVVARKVNRQALRYSEQLKGCREVVRSSTESQPTVEDTYRWF